jgi:ATP-dependent helicase/nuclease subunit A
MPHFTPDQRAAIETLDRNVVVIAGAGSGKTRVLVERYLRLLETHDDWELNQLVAITFTQKASQEMRDRVRSQVQARLEQAQAAADGERAAAVWSRRLSSMDSARIDTIHALCATILRQNAAEAGIDPQFEVLDETGARILLDTALEMLLVGMARMDDPAAQVFEQYNARSVREVLVKMISISDLSLSPRTRGFSPLPDANDLFAVWSAEWEAEAAALLGALAAHPDVAAGGVRDLPAGDDKLLLVWRSCQMHLQSLQTAHDIDAQLAAARGIIDSIELRGGAAAFWGSKEAAQEERDWLGRIRDAAKAAIAQLGERPNHHDQQAAALLPLWAALLGGARAAYAEAKRERSALDFDDLEALTRQLLREQPQVRARYRVEFKHLLVDEFQDTNESQWEIIRLLADPAQQGGLFIVGDPKQSIYSFRGADVRAFEGARDLLLAGGGTRVALSRSFRTHAPMVTCFNTLFAAVLVRDPASPAAAYQIELGDPMDAARESAPDDAPFVELTLIDTTDVDEDGAEVGRIAEAHAIASRIHRMVDTTLIYDREKGGTRPLRYDDCALLFRAMRDVPLYEDVFKNAGLPFVTVAGQGYYDRQEVWDLLNLLNALYFPSDELALAAALRSPLFALSDDALYALRLRRDESGAIPPLWDALADPAGIPDDDHAPLAFAHTTLLRLRAIAGRVTIAELLDAALDATGFLAVLTGLPDGARRRGNVEKLLEKARTSGKITLGEFSQYLTDLTTMEAREGEASLDSEGAVTLMTIHKSKGLEYPVVFLVDAARESRGSDGVLLHDADIGLACKVYDADAGKDVQPYLYRRIARLRAARDDAESRRLLYVAATRAQDRLFISGLAKRKAKGGWTTGGWLEQIMEAFALGDVDGDGDIDFAWGKLTLRVVDAATPQDVVGTRRAVSADATNAASTPPLYKVERGWGGEVDPDSPSVMPPLMARVHVERDAPARSLSATQIATIGAYHADMEHRAVYRQRFWHSLTRGAPERIERVTSPPRAVAPRKIGEIVHRALRWWQLPTPKDDLTALLRSYAWEEGVIDPDAIAYAVGEARHLLEQFRRSPIFPLIDDAVRRNKHWPELPFVFQTDKRVIHGKLDALVETIDGKYVLVDYKSSTMRGAQDPAVIVAHARRYHLQVGVYAAAVERMTSTPPAVYIHYIRYNQSIPIETDIWKAALAQLEPLLGDVIEDV